MTHPEAILSLLAKARNGLSARRIFKLLENDIETDLRTVHVILSQLVKRDYLRLDGTLTCSECAHSATCYKISDQGRIKLNGYKIGRY